MDQAAPTPRRCRSGRTASGPSPSADLPVDAPSGAHHVADHLVACQLGGDQGERGQPSFVDPKLIEQRDLHRDLVGGIGSSERHRDDDPDDLDIAWLFLSYQHPTIVQI